MREDGPRQDRRDALFDLLADNPDGLDKHQIMAELGCHPALVTQSVRDLRRLLADAQINVTVERIGRRQVYRLTGTYAEAKTWHHTRLDSLDAQLETMTWTVQSLVNGSDGRSNDGKRARYYALHLGRLAEDLRSLEDVLF